MHYVKMAPPTPSQLFSLRRKEPELIVPAGATPHELKQLSDIDDQESLRFQMPFIMFYHNSFEFNPIVKGKDPVKLIRAALARALVYYYPLAGRLTEGPNRKLFVDCNAEGALFIEADADVTVEQLGDAIQPPCPYLQDLLYDVPGSSGVIGCPLLLIQVTRTRCGGFILALRVNHTMTDAVGIFYFLRTVAEMAKGDPAPSQPPVWQREILNARNPPRVTCVHHEYEEVTDKNGSRAYMDRANLVHKSFFFGSKEIITIRKHVSPHLQANSTFEILAACLWKCRTIAMEHDPNDTVRLSYTVSANTKQGLRFPVGYYGNAFAMPAVLSKAELVSKHQLGYAVELARKIKRQMSEEYMRSVADLMVIKGRPAYSTTVDHFIVTDSTRVPFREIDFGWGKAVYAGIAEAAPNTSFCVRFKNGKGEDGIVVQMSLPWQVMVRFQKELAKMSGSEPPDDEYFAVKSKL